MSSEETVEGNSRPWVKELEELEREKIKKMQEQDKKNSKENSGWSKPKKSSYTPLVEPKKPKKTDQLSIDLGEEIKKIYDSGITDPLAIFYTLQQTHPAYFNALSLTESFDIQEKINEYVKERERIW